MTMVTMVLGLGVARLRIWNDDASESEVWRSPLAVRGSDVHSGPVRVGYVPVQYETVVVIAAEGKTKLNCVVP